MIDAWKEITLTFWTTADEGKAVKKIVRSTERLQKEPYKVDGLKVFINGTIGFSKKRKWWQWWG